MEMLEDEAGSGIGGHCKSTKSSDLPPCRVCGGPGDGLHYGANTCKACKGFFHRSLQYHILFKCKQNENCSIIHGMNKMCQFCRYQRCLAVGMSKMAIKIGRYTSTKRTQNILEVKGLKTKKSATCDGNSNTTVALIGKLLPYSLLQKPQSTMTLGRFSLTPPFKEVISRPSWNFRLSTSQPILNVSCMPNIYNVEIPCLSDVHCTAEETDSLAALYRDHSSVLKSLVDAHTKYLKIYSLDTQNAEDISIQQQKHYETCKLHKEMLGPWTPVPNHVYDQCFHETGIDLDNRQKVFSEIGHSIESAIHQLVKFVKVIPGFSGLQLSLQASLITYACIELILINDYHQVHSELCVLRSFTNEWLCSEEPIFTANNEPMGEYVKAARKIQAMRMTHSELVLFMAMVVMTPENSDRANAAFVEQIQWHIAQMLIQELGKRFSNAHTQFAKVIDIILHAHIVTDLVMKFFIKVEFNKHIENIPLVREMMREFIGTNEDTDNVEN